MKYFLLFLSVLFFHSLPAQTNYDGNIRDLLNARINQEVINIPKGTYLLDLTGNNNSYTFSSLKNVEINGNGSLIVCNYQKPAFAFADCENVTFSNFIVDYDPPCSTQGTITAVSGNNNQTLEVEIHEGYPLVNPACLQDRVQIYSRENRELVQNFTTTSISASNIQVNASQRKVTCTLNTAKKGVYGIGDYIVFNNLPPNFSAHTIITTRCKNMTFDRITLYDSPMFAFVESDCERSYYYHCVVDRRTNDPLRPEDRLRSSVADGLHSLHAGRGPVIEGCTIRHCGDDPIAIHGSFYPVYKTNASRRMIYVLSNASLNNTKMKAGDSIVCVGNSDGTLKCKGIAENITAATNPSSAEMNACFALFSDVREKDRFTNGIAITFSEEDWEKMSGVATGDILYSDNRIGNGFQVIDNYVGHNRSRGILIKAGNGMIRGNHIVRSAMSGIAVAPEFYWMESGLSQDLDISDNILETCLFEQNMSWTSQAAAISVVCQTPRNQLAAAGAFHNIRIYRNIIRDCPKPCVLLNAIDGGYYYENTIEPATWTRQHGLSLLIPNNVEFYTKNVRNIGYNPPTSIGARPSVTKDMIRIDAEGCISFKEIAEGKSQLAVYDLTGKLIFSEEFMKSSSLSLNDLEKGVYIIKITNNNHLFSFINHSK